MWHNTIQSACYFLKLDKARLLTYNTPRHTYYFYISGHVVNIENCYTHDVNIKCCLSNILPHKRECFEQVENVYYKLLKLSTVTVIIFPVPDKTIRTQFNDVILFKLN